MLSEASHFGASRETIQKDLASASETIYRSIRFIVRATKADKENNLRPQFATLRVHEEALPIKKAKFGPDDRSTLITMTNLANCYHRLKQYELAFPEATRLINEAGVYLYDHARFAEA